MKPTLTLLAALLLTPLATLHASHVQDRFHSLPPGSVKLEGFIQARIQQQADFLFGEKALAEMVDALHPQPCRRRQATRLHT